jgi:hypothetical protein
MPGHKPLLPHAYAETGQSSMQSTPGPHSKRTPEHAGIEDHHAAKHARGEGGGSQSFIPPPKIDEE